CSMLFRCCPARLTLYSFPTRRSSDLQFGVRTTSTPPVTLGHDTPLTIGSTMPKHHRALAAGIALFAGIGLSIPTAAQATTSAARSEEHTSELQSRENLVCRLLLEKKK